MKRLASKTAASEHHPEALRETNYPRDEGEIAQFGKNQRLRRNFGLLSIVGLTCALMITWEGSLTSVSSALASSAFLGGTMIQGLLVLNYDGYTMQRWHGTLLFYAIISLSLVINTYLARLLPKIEAMVLIIHVVGFVCILIPLVYLAPHSSAEEVFTTFINGGGWSTKGADAATHMAEEIESASTVIPRSMLASIALNGSLGFAIVTATLFCLGDEQEAIHSPTGFPFIQVFMNATGSKAGANAMVCRCSKWQMKEEDYSASPAYYWQTSIIITAQIFAAVGYLATASRMLWAFAREQGLPGSSVLARVEPHTLLPLYSIGLSTIISLSLALINIGSTKAFNALTSLVVAAFYSSFGMAAAVLLHRKLSTKSPQLLYGPFTMGRAGVPITVLALLFSILGTFFSFWPPTAEVDAVAMNWSIAVFGGVLLFSLLFWVLHGRTVYTGPIWETQQG
ncbi:MAG: hypothetical protein Q9209_006937 [Squamulea sp. 1 TL-2023]